MQSRIKLYFKWMIYLGQCNWWINNHHYSELKSTSVALDTNIVSYLITIWTIVPLNDEDRPVTLTVKKSIKEARKLQIIQKHPGSVPATRCLGRWRNRLSSLVFPGRCYTELWLQQRPLPSSSTHFTTAWRLSFYCSIWCWTHLKKRPCHYNALVNFLFVFHFEIYLCRLFGCVCHFVCFVCFLCFLCLLPDFLCDLLEDSRLKIAAIANSGVFK